MIANANAYDASSIVVLRGLSAVRRHPSLYIGSTGVAGLHQLIYELLDNALDEATAGCCTEIRLALHRDGSCSVEDDGRGIPTELHPEAQRPACEVVLTTLHSGGKFKGGSYARAAGLHGVGVSCVNALSDRLELEIWRQGRHHRQEFRRGEPTGDLEIVGPSSRHGTRIRFLPDASIFETTEPSRDVLVARLEEIAFLQPGVEVHFFDERTGETLRFRNDGGVVAFLEHRNRGAKAIHPRVLIASHSGPSLSFDVAFQWTEGYAEQITSFVNGVRTVSGGSHVDGFKAALAKTINAYAQRKELSSPGEIITALDLLEGLTAVMAVCMDRPQFDGQIKSKLQSSEVNAILEEAVSVALLVQLEADELLGTRVVRRAIDAARVRMASRLAARTSSFRRGEIKIDEKVYQRQFGIRSSNWHDSCTWLTDRGLLSKHAELCDVTAGARMLDVCCGSGVVGDAFKGRVGESIGLDLTPEMVREASKRLDRVHQGTVYALPFDEASFDLVVNREVLHLLPQPEKPVSEIFRVLRPGGQFIVGQIVPYGAEDAYWMFRVFKKKQPLLFQMFLEEDFRRLLLGAGFVDLKMEEYFLWESIDRWIDTHETTPAHRQEIYRLFYDAPEEVRAIHPFEVSADGSVRDQWRWCVYSVRKPR